jgi:very-short-patch-repair endonuclease
VGASNFPSFRWTRCSRGCPYICSALSQPPNPSFPPRSGGKEEETTNAAGGRWEGMRRRAPSDRPIQKPGGEPVKVLLSRVMRRHPTRAEARLWSALRSRQLGGWKFRRQHVIVGYIVDFYCAELCLIVEVDGPVHDQLRPDDEAREAHLRRAGAEIVRFSNEAVLYALHDVLAVLARRCAHRAATRRTSSSPPRRIPARGAKSGMGAS